MRWVIGVVVGLTALVGLLILVFLIVLALEPPHWLQIVMGVALVAVAVLLTWLVASALGQRDRRRAVEDEVEMRRRSAGSTTGEPSSN